MLILHFIFLFKGFIVAHHHLKTSEKYFGVYHGNIKKYLSIK